MHSKVTSFPGRTRPMPWRPASPRRTRWPLTLPAKYLAAHYTSGRIRNSTPISRRSAASLPSVLRQRPPSIPSSAGLSGCCRIFKKVKDRALVREATIIAGYLGRDDIEAPTARRMIGRLANQLRPISGLPALHVTFGVLLFFVALLAIDVILSYFWQTSGWSLTEAARYPAFYIFNVSPWLIIAIGTAGGLGSIVSILTRIQSFAILAGTDRRLLWMIGAMRPVIGIAFALFLFAVLQGQILPFNFPQGPQANFEFVALAFIAGFSERLSRGVISTVEGRFLGPKAE